MQFLKPCKSPNSWMLLSWPVVALCCSGAFTAASSVQLRNLMRVAEAEATRKSAYDGLRSVGPFVAEAFLEIVKDRNKLARLLGFQDFYDYKVPGGGGGRQGGAEGMVGRWRWEETGKD